MSLKPKKRIGGRNSLDITGYDQNYSNISKPTYHSTNIRKDTIFQHIRWKQVIILYLALFTIIHYFERIKPSSVIKSCMWDHWESWPKNSDPHHSIIIGDPQIVDEFSYPNRTWIATAFSKMFTDNFLHRNHNLYNKILNPDSIIFVGDLFDGGREWNDTQWTHEYKRFNKIFNPLKGVRQLKQVPGNHDVGFGNGIDFEKYSRFKAYFGNADEVVLLGNHSIVLLDTVSLSCTDDPRVNVRSQKFLSTFQDSENPYKHYPRIAISHVPLYRFTELQTCGKFRESDKKFPVVRGKQYQTVLEYEISQKIINTINPILIFSGDDHDYCHIRHPFNKLNSMSKEDYEFSVGDHPGQKYTDEITIKASSASGGIKKPAIQLLSLWNPDNKPNDNWKLKNKESQTVDSETAITHLCYLPSPYQPLFHYANFLILSITWIYVCTIKIDLGYSLNLTFEKYGKKVKRIIRKVFKKDIKSVDMSHLDKKQITVYEKYLHFILFEWEIENIRNWKTFFLNSGLVVILFFLTLLWYFKSI
jgi:hypothetical protein